MNIPEISVQGRLVDDNGPLQGTIWFIPTKPGFTWDDKLWATRGGHARLHDGTFRIELTPTDFFPNSPFYYDVYVGGQHWKLKVEGEGELQLADLLPKRTES